MNIRNNEVVTFDGRKYRVVSRTRKLWCVLYELRLVSNPERYAFLERKAFQREGQKEKKRGT